MVKKVESQESKIESQPNNDFESLMAGFLGTNPDIKPDESEVSPANYRSGYAALIGRPNAGKSTLLNRLVGEKIAAVSNKPQTTRHRIQGIVTRDDGQIVFVDTPGIHKPGHLLNRRMMAMVHDALASVDVVCLMRDAAAPSGNGDRFVLDLIKQSEKPAILVLNKTDKLRQKGALLPLIDFYAKEYDWREVIPISALKGEAVDLLLGQIVKHLPVHEKIFSEDELTDQPVRQIVAEMVREKILESTGEEIPYETAVVTEMFDEKDPKTTRIYCAIYVERPSQKAIIIGKGGTKLKQIGTDARRDIEKLLGKHVYLQLFVKVEEDWRNRPSALSEMGVNK
jgi:GTP-binding protein Era